MNSISKQEKFKNQNNGILQWLCSPKVVPYVFIFPFILFVLVVYLYPTISTIIMSFQKINGPTSSEFVGFDNYQKLFSENFSNALATTFRYTIWNVLILVPIPLLLSVIIYSKYVKGASFFRSLLFIPALTSIIVAGITFRLAFGGLDTALVNRFITSLGFPAQTWLQQANTANFVLVVLTLWRWLGVNIIYFYAGLQTIPSELYEAADIDGANAIQKLVRITLPGIRPVIIYVSTLCVLGGFSMFTESVALWQQVNPGGIGRTIVGYMYMVGFQKSDMGSASAIGLTLMVLVLAANIAQLIAMGFFRKED